MSKIKFGIGALQAAQENYQIILDKLIRGYQKIMKKDPEGLDLIKIKQEAKQRAEDSAKVVDMKGRTLNPDKPIMGGTQETRSLEELLEGEKRLAKKESKELMDDFGVQMEDPTKANYVDPESEEGIDVYNKYMRKKYNQEKFGESIKGIYDEAKGPGKGDEMVEALKSPGARASTEIIEKQIQETFPDIKLFGDETFEEILEIQRTGKHPRMKADGGRINFRLGGPTGTGSLPNIIGADLIGPGLGSLGGMEEEDELAEIQGQTAGLGLFGPASKALQKVFGPKVGSFLFQKTIREPVINKSMEGLKKANDIAYAKRLELEEKLATRAALARAQEEINRMGYQDYGSGGGLDSSLNDPVTGEYTGASTQDYGSGEKDGGLITMFVEKR